MTEEFALKLLESGSIGIVCATVVTLAVMFKAPLTDRIRGVKPKENETDEE